MENSCWKRSEGEFADGQLQQVSHKLLVFLSTKRLHIFLNVSQSEKCIGTEHRIARPLPGKDDYYTVKFAAREILNKFTESGLV